jgi:hypothetical protein
VKTEYIILDASVKYIGARNPLEEGLLYNGTSWSRKFANCLRYENITLAIEQARELQKEAPVKVFMLQVNGQQIGLAEIKF